jgi:hypothetical protein
MNQKVVITFPYLEIRFTIASAVILASSANAGDCPAICSRSLSNGNGEDEDLEAKNEALFNPRNTFGALCSIFSRTNCVRNKFSK